MKHFSITLIIVSFLITACKEDQNQQAKEYLTIPEVISFCKLPGKCGQKMVCEGQEIKVKGYIDYINIFDKAHYPQLPYEKFIIKDTTATISLEIWTEGNDNSGIFKKIYESGENSQKMAFINGIIEGWDAPTLQDCKRWIKINIQKDDNISFK
ncbi:MAG: hypothetical protein M1426_05530 [Patescibacteria group bacterium]|nr:hypothetical protein [Patescibacteria group bacterium]